MSSTAYSFTRIKPPKTGVLILLAEEGPALSPTAQALDAQSGGVITRAIESVKFKGKAKTALDLLVPGGLQLARLIVVGIGKRDDMDETDWASLGGTIRAKLSGREGSEATIIVEAGAGNAEADTAPIAADRVAEIALGAMLRGYKFTKYKTKTKDTNGKDKSRKELRKLVLQCHDPQAARQHFNARKAIGDGVLLARDLVNEPANVLGPREFANRVKELTALGVKVQVLDEKALRGRNMNALLAVGQGSARPSLMAVMQWNGSKRKAAKPVVIAGKGVCFDTGGISLKPAAGMEDMKGDMAGAACVAGLMHALAARKAKVNAVGLIGLVENMPGAKAQRPGDIVASMSKQTIEVLNTDAEGRLVLADVLWYAQETYKPRCLINLATLTGAVMVALGKEHAGMFSNDDKLCEELEAAGKATGEKVWRLPLGPKYDELIDSKIADMKNIGGRWGGSITAAQFLQRFVKKGVRWAHLDIAGTGMAAPKTAVNDSWGSGYGVRLLDRLVAEHYED